MLLPAYTVLLASVVFLNSVAFIRAIPRTLEDLFTGYKSVIPPVKTLSFEDQFTNFRIFGEFLMDHIGRTCLFRRDHIIFGWGWLEDRVEDEEIISPYLKEACVVFHMNKHEWINLPNDLCHKLGARRLLDLVKARDEVAATHVTTSKNPLYKEAHIKAYREANKLADTIEQAQAELINVHQTTIESSIAEVKREYSEEYNRVFMLYLHQHGEHNVNVYKKRRI